MKKYYKVVYRENNGDLVSVNRNILFPEEYGFGILTNPPRGTYSCSKIKLLERVH